MATKKKGFKLFDMNRDGKGVVEENTKPTLAYFFKSLWRKFPQLLRLNLLMLFQILPLIFIAIVFLAGDKTPSATSTTYAPLLGIDQVLSTPSASQTLDMSLIQMGLPVFSTAVTCTIIVLVLFLLVTWGWQNIGATYVLRGLVRGDAVFVFTDYFYAIKRNLKQGFFLGLIDAAILFTLGFDIAYFWGRGGTFVLDAGFFVTITLIIVYFLMRFYTYLLLVTFDLSILKVLKNALIFSMLGFKRNIMAFLAAILLFVIVLFMVFGLYGILIPIGLALAVLFLPAMLGYITVYAAYFKIKQIMIDPYVTEEKSELDDIKPIAIDRG